MAENILDKILQDKRDDIAIQRQRMPLSEIAHMAEDTPETRGFVRNITQTIQDQRVAVIAEIKRASPSAGIIREPFEPGVLAQNYQSAGASCLSVLTDQKYFQGTNEHLIAARDSCQIPVLRKDFTIDAYQIYEARAIGADCILLIIAALSDMQLQDFSGLAAEIGLDVLVEIHDHQELERAIVLHTPLLGINNRDLHNFNVDINTTLNLLPNIPKDRIVVTESGISTKKQVDILRANNVNTFLVGQAFMQSADPGKALSALFFS